MLYALVTACLIVPLTLGLMRWFERTPLFDGERTSDLAHDLQRYRLIEGARRRRHGYGGFGKTLIFALSVVVFGVSFGVAFSWYLALILLVLMLLHELGHLLGMHLFGYRDKQVLFIPFLGAVTIGAPDQAGPLQKMAVYFLGPVPGILLGFLLLWAWRETGISWVKDAAVIALVLNYLNLLPVMPLDGGQILRVLFFDRHPRWQARFLVASAFVVAFAAAYFGDVLLWVLYSLLILVAPYHLRIGEATVRLRQVLAGAPPPKAEEARLHLVMGVLAEPKVRTRSILEKHNMARDLMRRMVAEPVHHGAIMSAALIYVGLGLAPLWAMRQGWWF